MTILVAGTATPPVVVPPVVPVSTRPPQVLPLQITWAGVDGSRWVISGDLSAPVTLAGGFKGWGMPSFVRGTTSSPALPGTRWRRSLANEREVDLLLSMHGDGQAMLDTYGAFMSSLSPYALGSLEVRQPNGTTRRLALRLGSDGDPVMDWDLTMSGLQVFAMTLVAEQPFWTGEPIVQSWENTPPSGLKTFPTDGTSDYVLYISKGRTLESAAVVNPGNEPSFAVWTLTGGVNGMSGATVGVNGDVIEVPFGLDPGRVMTIDTRPDPNAATPRATLDDGTDVTAQLGETSFAGVPPTVRTPLSLTISGTGRIDLSLTPLYHRAIG